LLEGLVRRLSWGGNGRRGTARLELCSGSLAGATLLVHADGDQLSIELEGGDPGAAQELLRRVAPRLRERGLELTDVTVG
jgi:hypothetical protein